MLACGLPVVELAGRACEGVYGMDGSVITLAEPDPHAIAEALDGLLGDPGRRERLSLNGLRFVRERTWQRSTAAIEEALVSALRAQLPAWARAEDV
jgi:glycosyltransferase involved in cell wall biosynthesis